jgi:hypothetical protein
MKRLLIFFIFIPALCLLLLRCGKDEFDMLLPLPLNVYPTADTLHVGDTLWITAQFDSRLSTEGGNTIDANGARIDFHFSIPMMDDPTYKIYMHDDVSWLQRLICENGTCSCTIAVTLTRTGVFCINAWRLDEGYYDYKGKGALVEHDKQGREYPRVGVRYVVFPDKLDWYEELCAQYEKGQSAGGVYPFVVIE